MHIFEKSKTYWRLGPVNVARVGLYRFGIKAGLHPVLKIVGTVASPPFFSAKRRQETGLAAAQRWSDKAEYFSAHQSVRPRVPDWHANALNPTQRADASKPWYQIGDFEPTLGDIKTIWEASRFEWLIAMAQRAALGSSEDLETLNHWLADWAERNPPYLGVNWKCGQEASIRLMHLATSAVILDQELNAEPGLIALVETHLKRIAPTIAYAIGQQNNHGTSEAIALFIGGTWLSASGHPSGADWAVQGRRWLEDRARVLIEPDGTFSQYSVVYHRMMLDSYSLAEVWRRRMNLPPFSDRVMGRLRAATNWLRQMTDPVEGDAPNLGANDGAQLLRLADESYRDFRPSVQLASVLFSGALAFPQDGQWSQPLHWLAIEMPVKQLPPLESESFDHGGVHVLRYGHNTAYLRYPRFAFRPSQADALHLDFWIDGENILRDAGSYSYNARGNAGAYFASVAAHNSVQFDGRDQMPRLSRFLFGSWLQAQDVKTVRSREGVVSAEAAYVDGHGARHKRSAKLSDHALTVTDELSGKGVNAVLRWRLRPGDWKLSDNMVSDGEVTLKIASNGRPLTLAMTTGEESRHYLDKSTIPVLEVACGIPTTITTEVHF